MKSFERMPVGEWHMLGGDSSIQTDTWTWGPGRHSIANWTVGVGAEGEPWRVLDVYYWHPQERKVRLWGLHPFIPTIGRGLSQGSIEFAGDTAYGTYTLFQPLARGERSMAMRWDFESPNSYRETLLESPGDGLYSELAAWDYGRVDERSAPRTPLPQESATPTRPFAAFRQLVGHTWTGKLHLGDTPQPVAAAVEWIPLIEALCVRVTSMDGGARSHLADAYIYEHPLAHELEALVLMNDGSIYDGSAELLEDGRIEFDLFGFVGSEAVRRFLRLDFTPDTPLWARIWSVSGTERVVLLDETFVHEDWEGAEAR